MRLQPTRWERALARVFPNYALRTFGARAMMETLSGKRDFDAVSGNRLRGDWANVTKDADAAAVLSLEALRNNIRKIEQETGILSGPIKKMANNVIGRGIRPQSTVREDTGLERIPSPVMRITKEMADRFNYQAERAWELHSPLMDAQLRQTTEEQQRLAFMTMYRDGEVLAVDRASMRYGRQVPHCTELIEIDRLKTPPDLIRDTSVRNGIRFNDEGVPVKYYVLRRHPGATTIPLYKPDDFEELDAFDSLGNLKVRHLFDPLRPGQSRGYSPLAAGLGDIQDVFRLKEAVVVAKRISACLAAFITSPVALGMHNQLSSNTAGQRIDEFEPGMIKYLQPGEDIKVHNPAGEGDPFGPVFESLMRDISNAADMPYELFSGNWGGMNYSNARTVLLQAYIGFRIYQQYMINHYCIPQWTNFITDCVVGGLVDAPYFRERRHDYLRCMWVPPGWQWVDPSRESEAARSDLDASIDTLAGIIASKGQDWEETLEQRARELKRIKELEERHGITFPTEQKPATAKTDTGSKEDTKNGE